MKTLGRSPPAVESNRLHIGGTGARSSPDGTPDLLRGQGHVDVPDPELAQGIDYGADHGRWRAGDAGFAAPKGLVVQGTPSKATEKAGRSSARGMQ